MNLQVLKSAFRRGCKTWLLAVGLSSLLVVSPASASTVYDFVATAIPGNSVNASDFTIQFLDNDNDALLGIGDIINSFSGVTAGSPSTFYNQLIGIPDIAGLTDGGAIQWLFRSAASVDAGISTTQWTYSLTAETASATPVPGALPLFVTGLGSLGLLGWLRKKKEAAHAA